jgi:type I restriction enzyme S subunit
METTEYRLGDVCKLRNGYAFKSENFTNEGVSVIRISNINDNEATTDKALKTNPSSVFEKFAVKKGDILIAMSGATTGKFGRYISDEKAYQNQRVGCFVIIDEGKLSNDYLYLLLNGLKRKIERDAYGGGQPNISSTQIENYIVHLPSLKKQEQIVSVLSKADTLIKLRKNSISLQNEFLKNIFLKMFGDPVTNEKGWSKLNGGEYCEKLTVGVVIRPASYYVEDGVIALRSLNIKPNRIDLNNLVYFSKEANENELSKSILREGDVVFVRTGVTGTAAIIPKELDGCNCIDLIITRPKAGLIHPKYLTFFFNSDFGKKIVSSKEVGGIQKHFNIGAIKELKIPVPPFELQTQFSQLAEKTELLKEYYNNSLAELENLLGSLTQRAFRGDLNIVEKIEIKGSLKIQPKISVEVIAIDNMNKQLADFHQSIPNSGAPTEIDNKLKQLDAELKISGEIPYWDEYVKYRLIKASPFSFDKLWKDIVEFPFKTVPDYDKVKEMIFNLLKTDRPFLKQRFNERDKKMELLLNETT